MRILLVNQIGEIASVVEDHVERLAVLEHDGLLNTPQVLLLGLALPGVDWNAGLGDSRGGVVLSREDVAARPLHLGAELAQRLDEHGRLNGHVKTTRDASAL